MSKIRTDTLKVPGATLYYEVCGTDPVLLLIPGGPADAGGFAPIRNVLSDRYTVLTYDPRGLSRSPLDGGPEDTPVQTFADDAHQLLAALATEAAFVLGDSSGGLVGLELVSQHPEQVGVLVAHEPPLSRLLDDAEEHARFGRDDGPDVGKYGLLPGAHVAAPWRLRARYLRTACVPDRGGCGRGFGGAARAACRCGVGRAAGEGTHRLPRRPHGDQ
jgi:pimeloyl-ACP methyl ester carboxylesterase